MANYVRWALYYIFNVGNRFISLEIEVVVALAHLCSAMGASVVAITMVSSFNTWKNFWRKTLSRT